jgi:hypothetical protein
MVTAALRPLKLVRWKVNPTAHAAYLTKHNLNKPQPTEYSSVSTETETLDGYFKKFLMDVVQLEEI